MDEREQVQISNLCFNASSRYTVCSLWNKLFIRCLFSSIRIPVLRNNWVAPNSASLDREVVVRTIDRLVVSWYCGEYTVDRIVGIAFWDVRNWVKLPDEIRNPERRLHTRGTQICYRAQFSHGYRE